jgi:hypothetical protein
MTVGQDTWRVFHVGESKRENVSDGRLVRSDSSVRECCESLSLSLSHSLSLSLSLSLKLHYER